MLENLLERIAKGLKNPNADLAYIRHWLSEFSALTNENYHDRLDRILDSKTN